MAKNISAFICGLIFSLGLMISQMSNPAKVLGFLDVFGSWDPSLALVMVGALATLGIGNWFIQQRPKPLFDEYFHKPKHILIDKPLLIGAAIFGLGWGLVGFCPGPAIVAISMGSLEAWVFVLAMAAGVALFWFFQNKIRK